MAVVQGREYSDVTTVTTAGTAVALGASAQQIETIIFRAAKANTGDIYIGNKAGDVASTTGFWLEAGDTLSKDYRDRDGGSVGANEIFVDSSVNGEKVHWSATVARRAK